MNALTKSNGEINDNLLSSDGSPATSLSAINTSLSKACGLDQHLEPSSAGKIKPSLLANLATGAILGYALKGTTKDAHFGFKNWNKTIDSLDENRSSASNYKENSYWILYWKKND